MAKRATNAERLELVRRALTMQANGAEPPEIAAALERSLSAVYRYLNSPVMPPLFAPFAPPTPAAAGDASLPAPVAVVTPTPVRPHADTVPPAPRVECAPGPQSAKARAIALEAAVNLWRLHTPDMLVADVFGVLASTLEAWFIKGEVLLESEPDAWFSQVFKAKRRAVRDSMAGYIDSDGVRRAGITERLFMLVGDDDPNVSIKASSILLKTGALRNFFGQTPAINIEKLLLGGGSVEEKPGQRDMKALGRIQARIGNAASAKK